MNTINFLSPSMAINFIKPISKRGGYTSSKQHDVYISAAIKSKTRSSNRYEMNMKYMSRAYKLTHWRYVKVGFLEDAVVICEGTSNDGYMISKHNCSLTNRHLIVTILKHLKINMPDVSRDEIKVYFKAEKLSGCVNYFKLTRI